MKFIHAADLHLDTPFVSISNFSNSLQEELKKSTYTAADKVFETAVTEEVDFVILAGDTYDNTERTLSAQIYLQGQFERLREHGIKVYLVYGNHDYYRNDFSVIKMPDNVTIFGDEVTTSEMTASDGQHVGITGFSYYQNHISDDMVANYSARGNYDYQIGILHAGIGDGNYAPFTVNELLTKGYDYWALGHIHKREILHKNPMIIYAGDTQGRNQNELGTKGFYLVNVENGMTNTKFVPSSIFVWKSTGITADESDTIDSLFDKITDVLAKYDETEVKYLITLTINGAQHLGENVIRSIERNELLNHFSVTDSHTILYKIYTKFDRNPQLIGIDQKYWDESSKDIFDLNDVKDMDNRLFGEEVIRQHIDNPKFIEHIKELTKNTINKKYIGD
ncbi:metallophosphoesterase family protein [Companilactobacillus jidongensis]|uniref:metallophosphoesterase family protein n=1 Tax=Companilactobacillus jidongensis TaxID=2486006 RepID=UPI000F7B17E2|nr:DNA repair exonuclease [Companilactobacillus jidongensis]